ncbi:MAG: hypothetical protein QOH97_4882 [Actinoplanes sp.]|jgi:hypothetical protein|nr:hypothetical protein [Actinoplanes sp.]
MSARIRTIATAVSALYIVTVGALLTRIPLNVLNVLLATLAVPLVWLIGSFCRWSAHQHANQYERDVIRVKGSAYSRERVSR